MARLNIEDSIYTDNRFFKLAMRLGSKEAAIGSLVLAWSFAQKFYLNTDTHRKIPKSEWDKQGLKNEIIDENLAKMTDGFVEMSGADKQFDWLLQKQIAGQKGGLAKAKRTLALASTSQAGAKPLLSSLFSPDTDKSVSAQPPQQKPQVNNPSATQNFNARFSPDAPQWLDILEKFGLKKRLERYLGHIMQSWETPTHFQEFIDLKATCDSCQNILKECNGDTTKARPRIEQFVLVCIKREIGVLSENTQAI